MTTHTIGRPVRHPDAERHAAFMLGFFAALTLILTLLAARPAR